MGGKGEGGGLRLGVDSIRLIIIIMFLMWGHGSFKRGERRPGAGVSEESWGLFTFL